MFAIVEIEGKQYKVGPGTILTLEKMEKKDGESVKVDHVLLKENDGKIEIGTPYLSGASVELKIKGQIKGDKIRVYKKKAKKRYEKTQGHRQKYTKAEVVAIN